MSYSFCVVSTLVWNHMTWCRPIKKKKNARFWFSAKIQIKCHYGSHKHRGNNLICHHLEKQRWQFGPSFPVIAWAQEGTGQNRPMDFQNLQQLIEAGVCESGQLCSKNQSQQRRRTSRNMSAEVLLLVSSLLLFPNEGVWLCRTNIPVFFFVFFFLSHFPSSPSYLVAFSFFSDSLLSKQPFGNEQWHLQDRI